MRKHFQQAGSYHVVMAKKNSKLHQDAKHCSFRVVLLDFHGVTGEGKRHGHPSTYPLCKLLPVLIQPLGTQFTHPSNLASLEDCKMQVSRARELHCQREGEHECWFLLGHDFIPCAVQRSRGETHSIQQLAVLVSAQSFSQPDCTVFFFQGK